MKVNEAEAERVLRIYDGEEVARIRRVRAELEKRYPTLDALFDYAARLHKRAPRYNGRRAQRPNVQALKHREPRDPDDLDPVERVRRAREEIQKEFPTLDLYFGHLKKLERLRRKRGGKFAKLPVVRVNGGKAPKGKSAAAR